jgi:hypothetical protein
VTIELVPLPSSSPLSGLTSPCTHTHPPSLHSLLAKDNCDDTIKVTPVPTSNSCSELGPECCEKTTCTWTHVDDAGNSVTASTEIVIQDTTPPVFIPFCANGAICLHPRIQDVPAFNCLHLPSLAKKCFRDRCNEVKSYVVECTGCVDKTNPDVLLQCDHFENANLMCFDADDRAQCCDLVITVTDTCDNVETYPMTVCWDPNSILETTPNGIPCLLPEAPFVFPG